jgi:predicted amidohydrolase
MNATWAVSVAKAGNEDGSGLIGGSCIVDPNGVVVAQAKTLGDEVIVAEWTSMPAARARRRCSTSPPTAGRNGTGRSSTRWGRPS